MKTNDLRFTTTKKGVVCYGEKCDIVAKIRLNDQCKNGHQDFAITGDIYKTGKRSDGAHLGGGCIHEEILKHFPKFKIFVDLHLSDVNGVPMYAVENGFYHLRNGFNNTPVTSKDFKNEFCNYYRVSPKQFDILNESENKLEYAILLKELDILERWNNQANEAIKFLEELTGKEFLNDSKKSQYNAPKIEDIQNFTKQKEAGYYSLENKRKRAKEELKKAKQSVLKSFSDSYKKTESEAKEEMLVKTWLVKYIDKLNTAANRKKGYSLNFKFENFIYYSHKKELNFNWLDYKQKMTEAEFKILCQNLEKSNIDLLPNAFYMKFGSMEYVVKS